VRIGLQTFAKRLGVLLISKRANLINIDEPSTLQLHLTKYPTTRQLEIIQDGTPTSKMLPLLQEQGAWSSRLWPQNVIDAMGE